MDKIMLDTNVFDELLSKGIDWSVIEEKSKDKYTYYISSIQIEEMEDISDSNKEKRIQLALMRSHMNLISVPSPAIVGYWRVGESVLVSDDEAHVFDNLNGGRVNDTKDAIIGATAYREGCIVVTCDTRFVKHMKKNNIPFMEFDKWWKSLGL